VSSHVLPSSVLLMPPSLLLVAQHFLAPDALLLELGLYCDQLILQHFILGQHDLDLIGHLLYHFLEVLQLRLPYLLQFNDFLLLLRQLCLQAINRLASLIQF
jgi:hypothetical protein